MTRPESDYSSQADYIGLLVEAAAQRELRISAEIHQAFAAFLEAEEVEFVLFGKMTPKDLAAALSAHPEILKPMLAACNVAARAIERDLGIRNLNTYKPRLTADQGLAIAAYVKPFLPDRIAVAALTAIDRVNFIDKEMRLGKGQWEKSVMAVLIEASGRTFTKRKFTVGAQQFELDAAHPPAGEILLGVDVKRIEARRDIHKRSDEIVNKASKFKRRFPAGQFATVIYYPFVDEHANVQSRLASPSIDGVAFAGSTKSSIDTAVRLLLRTLGLELK